MCLRVVCRNDAKHCIREEFIHFQAATNLTGEGLAGSIVTNLEGNSLNLCNRVGQGYDGASAMSGCVNGVQTRIREKAPLAIYFHCASHVLNLVLNTGNNVYEIRNMHGTVKSVTNFINESATRRETA